MSGSNPDTGGSTPKWSRLSTALHEYGYRPQEGGQWSGTKAPVLTLVCKRCLGAPRNHKSKLPVVGEVIQTSTGFLLRADQLRRREYAIDRSDPNSEWQYRQRKKIHIWHFLDEPLDKETARWFTTCDVHGQIPLPSRVDLADAARNRRVTRMDI